MSPSHGSLEPGCLPSVMRPDTTPVSTGLGAALREGGGLWLGWSGNCGSCAEIEYRDADSYMVAGIELNEAS